MAVTVDAASTEAKWTTGTSFTLTTFTIGATANALVCVVCYNSATQPTGLAVTWNSVAMTLIAGASGPQWVGIFGLINPTTGNHTLSVSTTGTPNQASAAMVSFIGVNVTSNATAFINGTAASGTNNATTTDTLSTTNNVGDYSVCIGETGNGTISSITATSSTSIFNDTTGAAINIAASYAPGAASLTWTLTNSVAPGLWGLAALDVAASAAADVLHAQSVF